MTISIISQRLNFRIAMTCLGFLAALLGYFSLFTVAENELVILTRFGRPARIIENAGLQIKLPGFLRI